jgi:hypothetical protein
VGTDRSGVLLLIAALAGWSGPAVAQEPLVYKVGLAPVRSTTGALWGSQDRLREALSRARDQIPSAIGVLVEDVGPVPPDDPKLPELISLAQKKMVLRVSGSVDGNGANLRHAITHYLIADISGGLPPWSWGKGLKVPPPPREENQSYVEIVRHYILAARAFRDLDVLATMPGPGAGSQTKKDSIRDQEARYLSAASVAVCQAVAGRSDAHGLSAETKLFTALAEKARVLMDHRDPLIAKLLSQRGCERPSNHSAEAASTWWECLKLICSGGGQS